MALAKRRTDRRIDYWPGFVDALSTLLLAIMFLLTVFVLAQFLLGRELSGKDTALTRLNSQINELTQLLALERSTTQDKDDSLANLQASLSASEAEKSRLEQLLAQGAGAGDAAIVCHRDGVGVSGAREAAGRQQCRDQENRSTSHRTPPHWLVIGWIASIIPATLSSGSPPARECLNFSWFLSISIELHQ